MKDTRIILVLLASIMSVPACFDFQQSENDQLVGIDEIVSGDPSALANVSSPMDGSVFVFGEPVLIQADAFDPDGLIIVRFWVDDGNTRRVIFEDKEEPYEYKWTPPAIGKYSIWVKSKDINNEVLTSESITINVEDKGDNSDKADNSADAIITSPQDGSVYAVGNPVLIKGEVSDPDGVTVVRFWSNDGSTNTFLFADFEAPYEYKWTPPSTGEYKLWIKSKDKNGNTLTSESVLISVTDQEYPPPSGPEDSINYPGLAETYEDDCRDVSSSSYHQVPYYRIRVDFNSSADWSTLKFGNSAHVIKVRTISTSGVANKAIAEFDGVIVNQPKLNAQSGKSVRVVADYALRPEVIDSPFGIRVDQGSTGTVTLKVSKVTETELVVLKELKVSRGAQFDLDFSSFEEADIWTAPVANVKRMAWALYYPWYDDNFWKNDYMIDLPVTRYDSGDPVAINRQITQAKSAGIDGFLCSWFGPGVKTDNNLPAVLDQAAANDFKIGCFLETRKIITDMNNDQTRIANEIVRQIAYYITKYGKHEGLMKVDGKPLIMPWVSCTVPVNTWKNVRNQLKNKNIEITLMADCSNLEYMDVFDGGLGRDPDVGKTLRYYALLSDSPAPKIWMSSAMPGYDERELDRENPRYYPRENGRYYRNELNTALLAIPQWIRIYTWNEYPENTYVEPSVNYGDYYLNITGDYLEPWKCR